MPERTKPAPPSKSNRRSGADRRKVDKSPPGGRERRVSLEPRMPDVVERDITPSEWDSLRDLMATPPKKN